MALAADVCVMSKKHSISYSVHDVLQLNSGFDTLHPLC